MPTEGTRTSPLDPPQGGLSSKATHDADREAMSAANVPAERAHRVKPELVTDCTHTEARRADEMEEVPLRSGEAKTLTVPREPVKGDENRIESHVATVNSAKL